MGPATIQKLTQAVGYSLWVGFSSGYVTFGIVGVVHLLLIPLPDALLYGGTFSISFLFATLAFWIIVARPAAD
jgi:hypothetical protein